MKIITGGPATGKTYLARRSQGTVWHTDRLITGRSMDEQIEEAKHWIDALKPPHSLKSPDVIEGATALRALRDWVREHPGQRPPVDEVVYLRQAYLPRSKYQENMAKGMDTVWRELEPELRKLGVKITEG